MGEILNLTQHNATQDQIDAGVVEPKDKTNIQSLLTFEQMPSRALLEERAAALAGVVAVEGYEVAMIGGAPFFMPPLELALQKNDIQPVYAFSVRESVETTDPETGQVSKTAIFKHLGFVGLQ